MKYIFILLFTFSVEAFSFEHNENKTINIVTYGLPTIKEKYVSLIKNELKGKYNEIDLKKSEIAQPNDGIYIAIGAEALQKLTELNLELPTIAVFVKNTTFHHTIISLKHEFLAKGQIKNFNHIGSIYSDPSLEQQILLIKKMMGQGSSFGVMLSPITSYLRPLIEDYAKANNLVAQFVNFHEGDNINQAINSLKRVDSILAIPDRTIWNSSTLKNIILSTYRNEQPVIGFSRNMVKAGAVATIFSDLDSIAKETIDRINEFYNDHKKIYSSSSKYYLVFTNDEVIRSLNINNPQS